MESRKALSLKAAYQFAAERGLDAEIAPIRDMEVEWDLSYNSAVRRGYVIELLQRKGLLADFERTCWPEGATPWGEGKIRQYLRIKERYASFLAGGDEAPVDESAAEEAAEQAFAAESDLRGFLADNLSCIEAGLQLYDGDGGRGVEFPVESGRIDLLAVDSVGKYVVIELKLSRGRNSTLGQLLYYMGWVDANLGNGPCRGVIVARDIADELRLAVQRVPGVVLYRYHLSVSLEKTV